METVSLANTQPSLGGVFGSLASGQEQELRAGLAKVDQVITELAKYFGDVRAGWEGTGLELSVGAGRGCISSFVEPTLDESGDTTVSFTFELSPGGLYRGTENELGWSLVAEIYADCQESEYCGNMHRVWEAYPPREGTPDGAVRALLALVEQVATLARETPLKHWLDLAGDDGRPETAPSE